MTARTDCRRSAVLPVAAAMFAWLGVAAIGARAVADELPRLGAARSGVSVSGISSGAYMAGQYQFAHASEVAGAAIIAGGPYGCAEARFGAMLPPPAHLALNASQSISGCMAANMQFYGVPNAASLADEARALAADGRIDPIDALVRHKVYLFSGSADQIVMHDIVVAAAELYLRLGVPKASIKTGPQLPAGHGFVTEPAGQDCGISAQPFVVHCGYDQAGDLLAHIYGPLAPRSPAPSGTLATFDQGAFTVGLAPTHLAQTGIVYVPQACRDTAEAGAGCRVHISFHGCQQTRSVVGDAYVAGTGFARWADTNRLIILFPQVASDPFANPLGCWDWWGYTGFDYLTKRAPQVEAVHRMVAHLASRG